MTPKQAIHKYCVEFCMFYKVEGCPSTDCALWEHRMNKRIENKKLTSCRAIKARCKGL